MSGTQIKIWYTVLIGGVLAVGFSLLGIALGAEALGIDENGGWGIGRILLTGLGLMTILVGAFLAMPAVKKRAQTYRTAYFLRYIAQSVMWTLFVIGIFELILRLIFGYNAGFVYEKIWGQVPIAGSMRVWGKEGYGITHYLVHGEIKTPFDDGTMSVVVLGDSHTEALQVSDDDKFVSVAETYLRSKGNAVNLHNLGKSGNSIPDYIYFAPIIKKYYNPDIIIVQLTSQDFLGNNGGDAFDSNRRNYFAVTDSGVIELIHEDQSFETSFYTNITQGSMIYTVGRINFLQIIDNVNKKNEIGAQFQPVDSVDSLILPAARLDEQLMLLKAAYSDCKVILLILPYSPKIEGDKFEFNSVEDQKIIASAEKIGGFYVVYPQSEFYELISQGHLPRGFMNSRPGTGHLNIFKHIWTPACWRITRSKNIGGYKMSFISVEFAILITVVLALLAFIRLPLARKMILLCASCIFYAWWDWRFLGLLVFVTFVNYYAAHFLVKTALDKNRKLLLWVSILVNLSLLGFFKYFNFFTGTLNIFTEALGWRIGTLNIILPIGISFYTFETLSYVIDVYHGVVQPAKSLLDYAIFISFFPRLVAGPIMRASQFLPQLEKGIDISLDNFVEGGQYFLRGMVKKMVIADNVAVMADQIYLFPNAFSSFTVWLGIAAYSIQILYDFWGYSDMALGIGKMLGIELPINFNLPYTSQSITEFWNRWHITLSSWLTIPLPIMGWQKAAKLGE